MATLESLLPYKVMRGLARALRRRCPLCGGKVFRSWLKTRDQCAHCELRLDRNEPDYFFGAWTIGFVAAEFAVVLVGAAVAWGTWPEVPWNVVLVIMLASAVPLPLITIPYSRMLWLAADLAVRPPGDRDFRYQPAAELRIPPGK